MELIKALNLNLEQHYIISIIGGGGKTTALYILSQEMAQYNQQVLMTTTTRILLPEPDLYDHVFLLENQTIDRKKILPGTITLAAQDLLTKNKLLGLKPQRIRQLAEQQFFDHYLIEADGSQGRPLKVPADHEPVIPDVTNLVIAVTGWDAFFRPAKSNVIHRMEEFKAVTQQEENSFITETTLIKLINHKNGMFKGAPFKAKKIWFINKVDTVKDLQQCNKMVQKLIHKVDIDQIVIGSLQQKEKVKKVYHVRSL
ncbi:MAG: putative selenium-dependent hydroxylase accessory protein YqeC [Spirochaetes bacterium]|nr:putative selenium-dependent hydroxylase accessory protein YqeC [Spirochaetota bacterium]